MVAQQSPNLSIVGSIPSAAYFFRPGFLPPSVHYRSAPKALSIRNPQAAMNPYEDDVYIFARGRGVANAKYYIEELRSRLPSDLYDDGFWDDALSADKTSPGSIRRVTHPDDPDSRDVYVYNANQETLPDEYHLAEFRAMDACDRRHMFTIAEYAVSDTKHEFPCDCDRIVSRMLGGPHLTELLPYAQMPVLCAVLP